MISERRIVIVALLAGLLFGVEPAEGAFPGRNGKIAYQRGSEIWTVNPDGTGTTKLVDVGSSPTWSPDGTKLAYAGAGGIHVVNADGTSDTLIGAGAHPAWSPDGARIVFIDPYIGSNTEEIWIMNSDGTGRTRITNNGFYDDHPTWSLDGTRIAFFSVRGSGSGNPDIYAIDVDGTNEQRLTTNGQSDSNPDWSPDGTRIAFISNREGAGGDVWTMKTDGTDLLKVSSSVNSTGGGTPDHIAAWSPDGSKLVFWRHVGGLGATLWTVNSDGTGELQILVDSIVDTNLSWQPVQYTGYARPKGAGPMYLSLVPAYQPCTSPNDTHGAPLAFPSCSPPGQASDYLTLGTPETDGTRANSIGSLKISVTVGAPGPPSDSQVVNQAQITDVRCRLPAGTTCGAPNTNGGPDYVGELDGRLGLRITDKLNGAGLSDPATMTDYTFPMKAVCGASADVSVGATCTVGFSMDFVVPGMVSNEEGKRAIWAVDQVRFLDGGVDGDAGTAADNTLFETQGLFVP